MCFEQKLKEESIKPLSEAIVACGLFQDTRIMHHRMVTLERICNVLRGIGAMSC